MSQFRKAHSSPLGRALCALRKALRALFANGKGEASARPTPVVALIRDGHDRDLLEAVGRKDDLDIHFAETCDEAWHSANRLHSPVVLCGRDVPGIGWPDAVRILASAVPHPCVILTSRVTDEYLWKEIVARGGYDVLATPLREADTTRAIRLALSYWRSAAKGSARQHAFRR